MDENSSCTELPVDITSKDQDTYVDLYCNTHLSPCSLQVYNELRGTHTIQHSLYQAILNECIINALKQYINNNPNGDNIE